MKPGLIIRLHILFICSFLIFSWCDSILNPEIIAQLPINFGGLPTIFTNCERNRGFDSILVHPSVTNLKASWPQDYPPNRPPGGSSNFYVDDRLFSNWFADTWWTIKMKLIMDQYMVLKRLFITTHNAYRINIEDAIRVVQSVWWNLSCWIKV